jgi:uncharacterized protein with PQ loop repeat
MIFNYNILAYAGISIVSINLFPQIFLIINNKNADSVSYVTYIMNVISSLLLIIYAFNYELLPILIGNIMIFLTSLVIIVLKYNYSFTPTNQQLNCQTLQV